ncbi:MAG TPA: SusC/RagA family TonB-linked outer membrane protein [Longimicrobiaceae bacterium]|nr:SusC/RagA family TonB-linked outer membrane protein [Longimicrobiaceae bacterium]
MRRVPVRAWLLTALVAGAFASPGGLAAQQGARVSGTVTDVTGQLLPGASVVVDGTSQGAVTGQNGRYVIDGVAPGQHTLRASLVGYGEATQVVTVTAGQSATADFQLSQKAVMLEGIVAVGYGTQSRQTVTGAVASVNSEQLQKIPTSNAVKAMQDRVPGVDITNAGNKPGDGVSIRIRGVRSISGNNEPLYVVDGVPISGGIGDFNPADIVSIEILKDAASTAIYGSRGANGVVLVTTKGASTRNVAPQFTASVSYGAQSPYGLPQLMNNDQYVAMLQAAAAYAGVSTDPQNLLNDAQYQAYQAGQHTDWQDLIKRTGQQKNFQLGMNGSSGNTRYNISGNYFDQTGTAVGLDYSRATGTASIEHTLGRLQLGVTGVFTHSLQTVNGGDGLWGAARQQTGFGSPFAADGTLITNPDGDPLAYNPLKLVEGRVSQNRRDRLFASAFANFHLLDGVDYRLNFGPDFTQASAGNFTGADVQFGGASYRTASYDQNTNFHYTLDNLLQLKRDLGTANHLEGTLLYSIEHSRFTFGNTSANHIPYDEALYYAIGQGDQFLANSGLAETALESYMGRLVYTYLGRYTIMGAVRRDGASQLAPGHKWTTFPTVGVAWQAGDEPFLQNVGWLSSLKLRASWGKTGNAAISAYQTQGALANGKINFGSTTANAYYPNSGNPANPDLGWEQTAKLDAGVEFGLLTNRITGTVDVYRENTTDLLLTRSLPGTSGYTSALQNIGSTRNSGVEAQISSINLEDWHGLGWTMDVSWAHNKNEITGLAAYSDPTACPAAAPRCDANNGWFVGYPINTGGQTDPLNSNGAFVGDPQRRVWYDYKQIGVWQLGQEEEAAKYGAKPGQIRVLDLNGDGVINAADKVLQGSTYPKWTGSINNHFNYGNFDLSVLASVRWGYTIWNTFLPSLYGRFGQMVSDYWTPDNPDNVNPSPNLNGNPIAYGPSRGYISGSNWRIRNIQLGYTMPARLAGSFGATSARIYATATDPYVHYKYDYFDPEASYIGGSPLYRTLLIGADVTF